MSTVIFHASKPEDLTTKLAELDINVPERSEGRKSHHPERYCITHLLATLSTSSLRFPLTLTHRDKPDFLLQMPECEIGIEHTEAVPENVANAQSMRERGIGPNVYFAPHAIPGERRKTAKELRREIEANAPGSGWIGDSPEREWADAMAHFIREKISKATSNGVQRYPTNWLLVYDNWPLPAISYAKAAPYLAPLLTSMGALSVFNAIFVHDDSQMCEFGRETRIYVLIKPGVNPTEGKDPH